MLTLGVTIGIPEPARAVLRNARVSTGDPLGATVPPHITVLGPTEVATEDLEQIGDHLRNACESVEPFDVELRGTGTFRPVSPVVFVTVAKGISSCERLEGAIRDGILLRDSTFRYHPHVTVAHGVAEDELDRVYEELADFRTAFRVDTVELGMLGPDDVWREVRRYPLGRG